jgi:hypothetical protein
MSENAKTIGAKPDLLKGLLLSRAENPGLAGAGTRELISVVQIWIPQGGGR